ncbi:MAG TPA: hypothetical protein VNR11_03970 [Xanthobacteraceae bacterium]|nr:hypothetical protein [Xanthobacteraceae bacterium]
MPHAQRSNDHAHAGIPNIKCPRCRGDMRLAVIEPAAMSARARDTLVFECTCGFAYRQPLESDGAPQQRDS